MPRSSKNSILHLLEQYNVPGLSLALIKDGKLTWCEGFGTRSLTTQEPVDVNYGV